MWVSVFSNCKLVGTSKCLRQRKRGNDILLSKFFAKCFSWGEAGAEWVLDGVYLGFTTGELRVKYG